MIQKLIFGALVFQAFGEYLVGAQTLNLTQNPGEACSAKCIKGVSRVCYYSFTVEHYQAMGVACGQCEQGNTADCSKPQCINGDYTQKGVMSINRMIPGPPINVCEGDQVVVDVINMAMGTAVSLHWHGLHMLKTPYMDGVPYVTQCPILFESTFRYVFNATQPGTHFYHSHAGHHKLNGLYGAIIIRQPDECEPMIDEYDFDNPDNTILISDWRHEYAENSFPGLPKGVSFPDSLLINGRGNYIDKDTKQRNRGPVKIFPVDKQGYYKIRVINANTLTMAVTLQIYGYTLTVIETDSYATSPFEIDTIVLNAGERMAFVLDLSRITGDVIIRVRGTSNTEAQPTEAYAVIRYITKPSDYNKPEPSFPPYWKPYPIGYSLNFPNATCFDNDQHYCIADLDAKEKDTELITKKPDFKFTFSFYNYVFPVEKGFIPGKYVRFDNPEADVIARGVINNMSAIFPPQPILTQYSEVDKSLFCERSNCPQQCGGEPVRDCIPIVPVPLNSIIEMTLYDAAFVPGLEHPFHLHGYRFAVMGITQDSSNLAKAIEYAGRYRKARPVWKDTVSVPVNGVVVTRFRANNPGPWLLHCHYELHLATGMANLFLVDEPSRWVQAPSGFPKCGNYMPGVRKGVY